jgi:hypothetical protein
MNPIKGTRVRIMSPGGMPVVEGVVVEKMIGGEWIKVALQSGRAKWIQCDEHGWVRAPWTGWARLEVVADTGGMS